MMISSLLLSGSFGATVGSVWSVFSHPQGDSEPGRPAPLDSVKGRWDFHLLPISRTVLRVISATDL